jgi:hypothetical protein
VAFEFTHDLVSPTLPLEEGERVVAIQTWDAEAAAPDLRSLAAYRAWRGAKTIQDFGAYETLDRNLITPDRRSEPVLTAEITASAFRLARILPLLGRPLQPSDEQQNAPAVVVFKG